MLLALSPLDGRYQADTKALQPYLSEYALFYYRLKVEVEWLKALASIKAFTPLPELSAKMQQELESILSDFDENAALSIKQLELTTQHDVKAVEYYLKQCLQQSVHWKPYVELVHFACTSEDVNSCAYGLMWQQALEKVLFVSLSALLAQLDALALEYAHVPMLSRTHGQPASPTTMGKEFRVFYGRLSELYEQLQAIPQRGKYSGATGNFSAHQVVFSELNWLQISRDFVEGLGLRWQGCSTQIEPHDTIAQTLHLLAQVNSVGVDLARDMWGYISLGYFQLRIDKGSVGSSTMPHKVNPIRFENAEGNFHLSSMLANGLAQQLPLSRFQRDLVDSTLLRNVGVAMAHHELGLQSLNRGLKQIHLNAQVLATELDAHWEVLAEPIQTILRLHGVEMPYEILKAYTQGRQCTREDIHELIEGLSINAELKERLKALRPANYIGLATQIAKEK